MIAATIAGSHAEIVAVKYTRLKMRKGFRALLTFSGFMRVIAFELGALCLNEFEKELTRLLAGEIQITRTFGAWSYAKSRLCPPVAGSRYSG